MPVPDQTFYRYPGSKTFVTILSDHCQLVLNIGLESIQLQYHRRNDNSWPADEALLAEDKATLCRFMEKTHALSQEILSIFAEALGFPSDYFAKAHQVTLPDAQSTLRLLHYHDITGTQYPASYWRAGAHTDFDCMTMLFQRTGEDGLEVCPGREAHTSFARGDAWTPIEPVTGEIVCNIGDMLMAWSDDRFKSLFHRVRCPKVGENQRDRYSIA
jgi:isopenicillin N synthase-like dioxygenase